MRFKGVLGFWETPSLTIRIGRSDTVHSGTLGWNGFMAAGMFYWLVPRLWNTKLASIKLANLHFWLGFVGILLYVGAMWASGIRQGSMLNALDDSWNGRALPRVRRDLDRRARPHAVPGDWWIALPHRVAPPGHQYLENHRLWLRRHRHPRSRRPLRNPQGWQHRKHRLRRAGGRNARVDPLHLPLDHGRPGLRLGCLWHDHRDLGPIRDEVSAAQGAMDRLV